MRYFIEYDSDNNPIGTLETTESSMGLTEVSREVYIRTKESLGTLDLDKLKEERVAESKTLLEDYLKRHPYKWKDDKFYSITDSKTTLLMKAITSYQLKVSAGMEAVLKWNDTKEQCFEWELADLVELAITIDTYVAPLVAHQQMVEVDIRACETYDELKDIVISFNIYGEDDEEESDISDIMNDIDGDTTTEENDDTENVSDDENTDTKEVTSTDETADTAEV